MGSNTSTGIIAFLSFPLHVNDLGKKTRENVVDNFPPLPPPLRLHPYVPQYVKGVEPARLRFSFSVTPEDKRLYWTCQVSVIFRHPKTILGF